jgi:asparagine synthetase B (glutamine-hydrolysing)
MQERRVHQELPLNRLFGIAQTAGVDLDPSHLEAAADAGEGAPHTRGEPSSPRLVWGSASNGGVVLGKAHAGRRGLAYLGNIHAPFPDVPGGPSLDDPDRTARALLARFEALGLDFLRDVCGQFAVVLVEPDADRVILARGHGSAPRWFFAEDHGRLAFATRLADMPALQGTGTGLDRSLEDFLLGYEFLPDGRTPYRDVRTLLAGKLLDWRAGAARLHDLTPPAPWGSRFDGVDYRDEGQVVAALYEAFQRAVEEQTPASPRVGVLLGGVDSALVAVRLKQLGKDVHTFSFRYADASYNQAYTEELAQQFGLTHHWVPITPDVVEDGLRNYARRFNQTLSQPHYVIATAHVCRAIREHGIQHALTGDGCDGLFLGYPTVHLRAKLIQSLSRAAPLVAGSLSLLTRSAWLERRLGHPYRIGRNVGRILKRPMPARGHVAACTLDAAALEALRGAAPPQAQDTEQLLARLAQGLDRTGTIRLAYLGKSRVGLNGIKLDGSMSQSGISLNSPYLHPGLEQVAKRIPDNLNRPDRKTSSQAMGKYAFLQMIERHALLPREMVYQRKCSPVMAPVDEWYWGTLRRFMLGRLQQLPFPVDTSYAESLLEPKLAERLFRRYVGISRYVTSAAALLVTYASFAELVAKPAPRAAAEPRPVASLPA